jgi:hypothetical protein
MKFVKNILLSLITVFTFSACNSSLDQEDLHYNLEFDSDLSTKFSMEKAKKIQDYFINIDFHDLNQETHKLSKDDKINPDIYNSYPNINDFYFVLFDFQTNDFLKFYNAKKSDYDYESRIITHRFLNNKNVRFISKNLKTLLVKNKDDLLLNKLMQEINYIFESETNDYNEIINSIKNNQYIETAYLQSLLNDITLEEENNTSKPLINISSLITENEINKHINIITNFNETFSDQTFINEKIKEFQKSTITFSNKNSICFSHILTDLTKHFDSNMNIYFTSVSIDTDVIECSLVPLTTNT